MWHEIMRYGSARRDEEERPTLSPKSALAKNSRYKLIIYVIVKYGSCHKRHTVFMLTRYATSNSKYDLFSTMSIIFAFFSSLRSDDGNRSAFRNVVFEQTQDKEET
jgi:hypothetical protein